MPVAILPEETRALGALAARGAGALTDLVRGTHEAIAERSFGAAPASSLARRGHDAISALSYASARVLSAGLLRAGGAAAATATRERTSLADTRAGAVWLGALNGAFGDQLEQRGDPLAIETGLRHEGRPVRMEPRRLAAQFPHATEKLAVFIHGLCETERAWWRGVDPDLGTRTYGARLQHDLGYTPLYVRYNSGAHISTNGRRLAELLQELVESWPVEVEEIMLVGHSMGGLVARSAGRAAIDGGTPWVELVHDVFYLGSPHGGADLEKGANLAAWALNALPESRGLARSLNARSAGIKDLRFGYLLDADWEGRDPDERLRSRRGDVPFMDTATHYFIAATLTSDSSHPVGRLVGDLLVRLPSAWADGQHALHQRFDLDRSRCYGPLNHFSLLNHPAIYDQMRLWVESRAS
jgi:pimeloyl-ACP methyl ester carboxylesterase